MKRKKWNLIFAALVVSSLVLVFYLSDRKIRTDTVLRSSTFVAIDYAVRKHIQNFGAPPITLNDIRDTALIEATGRYVREEILYQNKQNGHYNLEERKPSNISLFRRDRRLASDEMYPIFESSHERISKQ